jgi:hypothetical protein
MSAITKFEALRQRVPDSLLRQRKQGGSNITFLSWYDACDLLDERAPGWSMEIKEVGEMSGKVFVRVALTIDGVTRENIGSEDEDMKGYGDVFSNSVGMALKRAAALFGLARHLYNKTDSARAGNGSSMAASASPSSYQSQSVPYSNAPKPVESNSSLVTAPQVGAIKALAYKTQRDPNSYDFDNMSKMDASRIIKELQEIADATRG